MILGQTCTLTRTRGKRAGATMLQSKPVRKLPVFIACVLSLLAAPRLKASNAPGPPDPSTTPGEHVPPGQARKLRRPTPPPPPTPTAAAPAGTAIAAPTPAAPAAPPAAAPAAGPAMSYSAMGVTATDVGVGA